MPRLSNLLYGFVLILILQGCFTHKEDTLFLHLSAPEIGITFKNEITESDSVNVISFTNIYNGGGVGVADFNKDGKPDLIFSGNMVSSRMYINDSNNGGILFKDITEESGIKTDRWCTGVSIADINNDSWPDIYLCVSGSKNEDLRRNYLFIHQGLNENGIPVFREMAQAYGLADHTYSTQAAFIDYDLDNDLDLFIAVNFADQFYGATVNIPTPNKKAYSDRSDRLYENTGPGIDGHPIFKDVSEKSGILHEGYTLGLVVHDINMDGWSDIYLANDFLSNDILYINQGDGTFVNKIGDYFKHTTFAGMGMDINDYNNDSWPDIFVLDMTPEENQRQKSMLLPTRVNRFMANINAGYYPQYNRNTLQLNNGLKLNGDLSFSEIGQLANIHHTDWSWTILLGDLTNSGYRDIMVCNGFRRDLQDLDNISYLFGDNPFGTRENWERQFIDKVKDISGIYVSNYLYENNGDLTFTNRSSDWGFNAPSYSGGGVMSDLDKDGDLDLVINNLDEYPFIYENRLKSPVNQGKRNYISIQLTDNPLSADVLGTKVSIISKNGSQYYQHYAVRGYLSSTDPTVHFGVGNDTLVNRIEVVWPDGSTKILSNLVVNRTYKIEKDGSLDIYSKTIEHHDDLLFKEVTSEKGLKVKHKDQDFQDFNLQPLLLHKYSQEGPGMAVADINNDGLDDLFLGAGRKALSQVLIQNEDGGFSAEYLPGTEDYEDMGALFFDANNDGLKDLYVVSGGFEFSKNSAYYLDRLYINDGKGSFIYTPDAIPNIVSSGSCVIGTDFDSDGDTDLFIGGRVTPGSFPITPSSYLLENQSDGGRTIFEDVTDKIAPGLKHVGMVTSALWTDFDNDFDDDLIVVGEWMPISVFENLGDRFSNKTEIDGLNKSDGWWNSIVGGDFDKDGDIDYVLGNLGLNAQLKATEAYPFLLYYEDYDRNGTVDPLFLHYNADELVPFHSRSLLIQQISFLDKKYRSYSEYADAHIENLLDDEQIKKSKKLYTYEFRSCYLENLEGRNFKLVPLPNEVQVSPVYGMITDDFNNDGNLDIQMVGNSYATVLRLGWYDASIGYSLLGNGDGSFKVRDGIQTGFQVDSDAKSIVKLYSSSGEALVAVASNNDSLRIFKQTNGGNVIYNLREDAKYAELIYLDNSKQKIEFYLGNGYLSNSAQKFSYSNSVKQVKFFEHGGRLLEQVYN